MTLYEINQELLACLELENGDIINTETGEVLSTDALDALEMARDEKIENIACQVKNLDAEAEAIKAEMGRLMERRKKAERKSAWLRDYLTENLHAAKFRSARCEIKFTKSHPLEIADESAFRVWAATHHPEMLRIKEPEIDKNEVKKAIKDGEEIPGATLAEKLTINIK